MKRIVHGVVALLLLLSMSGTARAEDEGTRVFAGLKTWINNWRSETPGSESVRSNTVALVGWEFEADFPDRIFLEASFLMSVMDYEFDHTVINAELERTDVDVALGYQFNKYVGVFTGYRGTRFKDNLTERRETATGMLFGIRGAVPLSNALSLVGRLTDLPWVDKATFSDPELRERAHGWIGEIGVTYAFTRRTTGALGYKLETTTGKNTRVKDTFAGSTFGVTYMFQ